VETKERSSYKDRKSAATKRIKERRRQAEKIARWLTDGKAHGLSQTREYIAYDNARERTSNPRCPYYPDWGGRGIKLLVTFREFWNELGPKPSPRHVLDRVNNNGHYAIGNMRWATHKESRANQRKPRKKKSK
jgi:hypothetical protein